MPNASFFTVDRKKVLREGQTLRLAKARSGRARRWFPDGLSPHGEDFVLGDEADAEGVRIELLLEFLRRDRYPRKPSRLQSFFAFGRAADARRFRESKSRTEVPIFELRARSGHRGDMRLLAWQDDFLMNLDWATRYWEGEATSRPQWEHLLRPPVQVVRRLDD